MGDAKNSGGKGKEKRPRRQRGLDFPTTSKKTAQKSSEERGETRGPFWSRGVEKKIGCPPLERDKTKKDKKKMGRKAQAPNECSGGVGIPSPKSHRTETRTPKKKSPILSHECEIKKILSRTKMKGGKTQPKSKKVKGPKRIVWVKTPGREPRPRWKKSAAGNQERPLQRPTQKKKRAGQQAKGARKT